MAHDVTIYTSNTCPYCVSAKDYLNERGVPFVEKNIQTDPEARKELMRMGHMGVPVIIIDGEEIVGFNKAKMDELLSK
ncbi:MAG: glutaredoxin family protein [Tissierellia bacterium]|nr:glutaredoxin family protein [Tissierellia bacterium]